MIEYVKLQDVMRIIETYRYVFEYESDCDELLADIELIPTIEIED